MKSLPAHILASIPVLLITLLLSYFCSYLNLPSTRLEGVGCQKGVFYFDNASGTRMVFPSNPNDKVVSFKVLLSKNGSVSECVERCEGVCFFGGDDPYDIIVSGGSADVCTQFAHSFWVKCVDAVGMSLFFSCIILLLPFHDMPLYEVIGGMDDLSKLGIMPKLDSCYFILFILFSPFILTFFFLIVFFVIVVPLLIIGFFFVLSIVLALYLPEAFIPAFSYFVQFLMTVLAGILLLKLENVLASDFSDEEIDDHSNRFLNRTEFQ